jgi:2-oxo-4-hydroxy-4-carboxy-5-ureidoimidazoline decarboxylase
MSAHDVLNEATPDEARSMLLRCCGSTRWAEAMLARRPFESPAELHAAAVEVWERLTPNDWFEAFRHHPRIGDAGGDTPEARRDVAQTASEWARQEQSAVRLADAGTLRDLREANASYEKRFGFLFLVCATGKSAEEMLRLLRARLANEPEAEIRVASREQAKITRLRLEKLER